MVFVRSPRPESASNKLPSQRHFKDVPVGPFQFRLAAWRLLAFVDTEYSHSG